MQDTLFEFKLIGNKVLLYEDRLVVKVGGMFEWKETIPLQNITGVELSFSKTLVIHTADGKQRKLPISGTPAEVLKGKIEDRLNACRY